MMIYQGFGIKIGEYLCPVISNRILLEKQKKCGKLYVEKVKGCFQMEKRCVSYRVISLEFTDKKLVF